MRACARSPPSLPARGHWTYYLADPGPRYDADASPPPTTTTRPSRLSTTTRRRRLTRWSGSGATAASSRPPTRSSARSTRSSPPRNLMSSRRPAATPPLRPSSTPWPTTSPRKVPPAARRAYLPARGYRASFFHLLSLHAHRTTCPLLPGPPRPACHGLTHHQRAGSESHTTTVPLTIPNPPSHTQHDRASRFQSARSSRSRVGSRPTPNLSRPRKRPRQKMTSPRFVTIHPCDRWPPIVRCYLPTRPTIGPTTR